MVAYNHSQQPAPTGQRAPQEEPVEGHAVTDDRPAPQASDLQLNNARQVKEAKLVGFGRRLVGWVAGALQDIRENPVKFALSTGASMAIRFAVTAGLFTALSITGGLPALALSIAASMITSVVMSVGKAALGDGELDSKTILKRAAISGMFAGVLGSLLGDYFGAGKAEVSGGEVADVDSPEADVIVETDFTKQYAFEVTSEKEFATKFGLQKGDHYYQVSPGEVNIHELKRLDTDWFMFVDEAGVPRHVMHQDGLAKMIEDTNRHAVEQGLKKPSEIILLNNWQPYAHVETEYAHNGVRVSDYKYNLTISTGALIDEKDIYSSVLDHELGHVYQLTHSFQDYQKYTAQGKENYADKYAFLVDDANYGGSVERMVRSILGNSDFLDDGGPKHPSHRIRLTKVIEAASKDDTLVGESRADFVARLHECQDMLEQRGLGDRIDLLEIWENANGRAGHTYAHAHSHSHSEMAGHAHAGHSHATSFAERELARSGHAGHSHGLTGQRSAASWVEKVSEGAAAGRAM